MPDQTRILRPGPNPHSFRAPDNSLLTPPATWACLPPGDAGLTRRVKATGPTWTVQEQKGRKVFSHGVWASAETIARVRAAIDAERATPAHAKKQAAALRRRADEQAGYAEEFAATVLRFLAFHPRHAGVAATLAKAVAEHATPVGSGTVARTRRIPIEDRAEAAVLAWMRHKTTGYDLMSIPRRKGERRAIRRELAERSRHLLQLYRAGKDPLPLCPLRNALSLPSFAPVALG